MSTETAKQDSSMGEGGAHGASFPAEWDWQLTAAGRGVIFLCGRGH